MTDTITLTKEEIKGGKMSEEFFERLRRGAVRHLMKLRRVKPGILYAADGIEAAQEALREMMIWGPMEAGDENLRRRAMNEKVFEMPVKAKYRKHKENHWVALLEPGCDVEVFRIYYTSAWEPFVKRPLRDGEELKLCLIAEEARDDLSK